MPTEREENNKIVSQNLKGIKGQSLPDLENFQTLHLLNLFRKTLGVFL